MLKPDLADSTYGLTALSVAGCAVTAHFFMTRFKVRLPALTGRLHAAACGWPGSCAFIACSVMVCVGGSWCALCPGCSRRSGKHNSPTLLPLPGPRRLCWPTLCHTG